VSDVIGIGTDNMNTSHEWHPSLLAEKIIARFEKYGVTRPSGVIDTARGLQGEMLHVEMQKEGFWSLRPPKKGRRSEGWTLINSMLQAAVEKHPNRPHIGISNSCKFLLATLPFMSRDENDPDDIAPINSCPGHALDALRYAAAEGRLIQPEATWQSRRVY
jgi:hypothetical protein